MKSNVVGVWFLAVSCQLAISAADGAIAEPGDQLFKLTASDPGQFDEFGRSVAIDRGTIVVGAYGNDDNGASTGSAYIYDAATGLERFKLLPSGISTAGYSFGSSVATDEGLALIGAQSAGDQGFAYLFDATTGQQLRRFAGESNRFGYPEFGNSVALDGGTALVGAYGADARGDFAGAAYLFDVATGRRRKLVANDAFRFDAFGASVALHNGIAIVGAPGDADRGINTGAAYLFDVATGRQLLKLTASDGAAMDSFGHSVDIHGSLAIVGAAGHDIGGVNAGAAYVFDVGTGQLVRKLAATDRSADDYFGTSVAIQGVTAFIGASGANVLGSDAGAAYMFNVTTGQQVLKLTPPSEDSRGRFGHSVAFDDDIGVVGASSGGYPPVSTGTAYVFRVIPEPSATVLTTLGFCAAIGRWPRRKMAWAPR